MELKFQFCSCAINNTCTILYAQTMSGTMRTYGTFCKATINNDQMHRLHSKMNGSKQTTQSDVNVFYSEVKK
jgi:hypothetical protein